MKIIFLLVYITALVLFGSAVIAVVIAVQRRNNKSRTTQKNMDEFKNRELFEDALDEKMRLVPIDEMITGSEREDEFDEE